MGGGERGGGSGTPSPPPHAGHSFGSLWELLGNSWSFCELLVALGAFGTLWELLGASGSFWELLGASGSFWETLGAFGKPLRLLGASASLVVSGIGLGPGVAHPFYIFQFFQTIICFSIICGLALPFFKPLSHYLTPFVGFANAYLFHLAFNYKTN